MQIRILTTPSEGIDMGEETMITNANLDLLTRLKAVTVGDV